MDDQGRLSYNKDYVRKNIVFNTQGFTFNEVKILSENLNNKYNLETWVKENKKKTIGLPILANGLQLHFAIMPFDACLHSRQCCFRVLHILLGMPRSADTDILQ